MRKLSQGDEWHRQRNRELWWREGQLQGTSTLIKHSRNGGDRLGPDWMIDSLKSTSKGLDFMPRAMESNLSRRVIGSDMYFQIFGTLVFSWRGNTGSRVMDYAGGSKVGSGQEEPTELGTRCSIDTGPKLERLPLASGRTFWAFFFFFFWERSLRDISTGKKHKRLQEY